MSTHITAHAAYGEEAAELFKVLREGKNMGPSNVMDLMEQRVDYRQLGSNTPSASAPYAVTDVKYTRTVAGLRRVLSWDMQGRYMYLTYEYK